ncbi:MAG TPA: serine/threonine protein kinase [Bifidobacterium sp.]|nr:serine/threonine protein kinase [Bifidobacterium sp.]
MSGVPSAPEGQILDGRYRVVSKIAEGGMAVVYQAIDERLARTVAVKIMHNQLAQGPKREQFIERFRREAQSAAAIANPHIVQVYDTGEFDGLDYLVMEYVHGVNLRHEMNQQGAFSVREALRILSETLDGLASAHHAGVVHRDIKPENILINDRGHVQITDFGLAKAVSQATLSTTHTLLGTAAYMPPELIQNGLSTMQGDLYAVGITTWEMLTGEIPFASGNGTNPMTLAYRHVHEDVPDVSVKCPGINTGVSDFIARLTARAVEDRPANAEIALTQLQQLMATLTIDDLRYRLSKPSDAGTPLLVPPIPPSTAVQRHNAETNQSETTRTAFQPNMAQPGSPTPAATSQSTEIGTGTTVMPVQRQGADPAATLNIPPRNDSSDARQRKTSIMTASPAPGVGTVRESGKARNRKPLIIAGVAAALMACCAGGWAWWYFQGPGSYWTMPQPEDLSCESSQSCVITDADWNSYKELLDFSNIEYETSEAYSDTVESGDIISTNPADVGAHVSKRHHQKVKVVVSKGIRQATVPADILDASSTDGKDPVTALKNAGFDNVKEAEASDDTYSMDVPQGAALALNVDPGAVLPHNTKIIVTVSQGPKPVVMPDVVGKTKDETQQALDELKLNISWSEGFDDKIAQGQVISTSVKSGSELHWGDTVQVVVSKGPETVTLPNYVGQKASDAKTALEKLGFSVKISSQLTLDSSQDKKVASQDPTGGTQVRLRQEDGTPNTITLKMYSSLF